MPVNYSQSAARRANKRVIRENGDRTRSILVHPAAFYNGAFPLHRRTGVLHIQRRFLIPHHVNGVERQRIFYAKIMDNRNKLQ
jgi:hypothetical protein